MNTHSDLDGHEFKAMLLAGYTWLEHHKEIVNQLNVFPVPDGDTGTNMTLTMRAAWREIDHSDDAEVGHIAQAAAQGALMGARGNLGVILSQILRGMTHAFRNKPTVTAHDLANGLRQDSDTAYKGVVKPVEGTILTVIREAADAAQKAEAVETDIDFVLSHVVQAAGEAVERTPSLLPVLAKAGVVDSGGKGMFYILRRLAARLARRDRGAINSTAGTPGRVKGKQHSIRTTYLPSVLASTCSSWSGAPRSMWQPSGNG